MFSSVMQQIYGNPLVQVAVWLIVADVVTGLALAIKNKDFYLAEVGNFLLSKAIPYVIGAGGLQLALIVMPKTMLPAEVSGVGSDVIWGFVLLALIGHVLDNARGIGLPVPAALGAKPKPETKIAP